MAKGQYIAFADNDDYLFPDLYGTLISLSKGYSADVAACDFQHATNQQIESCTFKYGAGEITLYSPEEYLVDFFSPTWKVPVWNKVYRKEIVKRLFFENVRLGEDNLFSYYMSVKCNMIVYIDRPMYVQRMHDSNFEFTGIKYLYDLVISKEKLLNDIQTRYPNMYLDMKVKFIYECIRVYNTYLESPADEGSSISNVFVTLRSHCDSIWRLNIPVGHKIILFRIKLGMQKCGQRIII